MGPARLQSVCLDANDPQRVAAFWAALLGREAADAGAGDGATSDAVLRATAESPGPTIWVNGVPHQTMAKASWRLANAAEQYGTPYERLPRVKLDDVLVVGAGVAGLSAALGLAGSRSVLVVDAAGRDDGGSSRWAQGGVAAAVRRDDEPDAHAADTAVAGAGHTDPAAVAVLVEEGPQRVAELLAAGARFDRDDDGRHRHPG